MLELLRKCLDLRDKYVAVSSQRLGDNPRDHDGVFHGIAEGISDVMGVRPEAAGSFEPIKEQFEPWRIYPRPPPPHWHWTADQAVSSGTASTTDVFDFTRCEIPGAHEWDFEIDDKGIYQIYHDVTGMTSSCQDQPLCLVVVQLPTKDQSLTFRPSKSISWISTLCLASSLTVPSRASRFAVYSISEESSPCTL